MRLMRCFKSGVLSLVWIGLGLAILSAEGSRTHRELQFFGDADDDTGFKYEFNGKNVTLLSNRTTAFCFSHQVGCVEYFFHVMQTEGASPRSILAFVAPERAARKAEEEHRIDAADVAKGSLCVMPSCDVSSPIDNSNDEDMCVVLVNSNFDFINTTEIEDFRPTKVDVVSIDLTIKGCPTTSQRIVAIVVPVAVFAGVAACFSAWWVRRRRKEYMAQNVATPSSVVNMVAVPPPGQQTSPMGQSYPPGYVLTAISTPRLVADASPVAGSMGHTVQQNAVVKQDAYPMKFAQV